VHNCLLSTGCGSICASAPPNSRRYSTRSCTLIIHPLARFPGRQQRTTTTTHGAGRRLHHPIAGPSSQVAHKDRHPPMKPSSIGQVSDLADSGLGPSPLPSARVSTSIHPDRHPIALISTRHSPCLPRPAWRPRSSSSARNRSARHRWSIAMSRTPGLTHARYTPHRVLVIQDMIPSSLVGFISRLKHHLDFH
jgi:hypothetical protein